MDAEFWIRIFQAVSGSLLVIGATGFVTLRDKILANRREIDSLNEKLKELKTLRENDMVEQKTLMMMATSIDTKIDAKLKDFMSEIAEQRRQDTAAVTKMLSEVNTTLTRVNTNLDYINKDIDHLKRKNVDA